MCFCPAFYPLPHMLCWLKVDNKGFIAEKNRRLLSLHSTCEAVVVQLWSIRLLDCTIELQRRGKTIAFDSDKLDRSYIYIQCIRKLRFLLALIINFLTSSKVLQQPIETKESYLVSGIKNNSKWAFLGTMVSKVSLGRDVSHS